MINPSLQGFFILWYTVKKKDGIMSANDDVKLEYLPIDELIRFPRNPKDHDLGQLIETISSPIGYVAPIIVDSTSGMIGAGHGRLDALFQLYRQDPTNPPKRIKRDKAGRWLVPVNIVSFANEKELEAYLIADNRLTELGGWDEAQLAENLQTLAEWGDGWLELTGYDASDLNDMFKNLHPIKRGEHANDPYEEYVGMPEYQNEDKSPFKSLIVHFLTEDDMIEFAKLVNQPITPKTKNIYYPKKVIVSKTNLGYK